MAEFKLSYTANEVNERLRRIDNFAEKNSLPKNTSDLINDSDFITKNFVENYAQPLGDYVLKSEITGTPGQFVVIGADGNITTKTIACAENGVFGASLISFTIDGTEYQVAEGTTWNNWIYTVFENAVFNVTLPKAYCIGGGYLRYSNGDYVGETDFIIAKEAYTFNY